MVSRCGLGPGSTSSSCGFEEVSEQVHFRALGREQQEVMGEVGASTGAGVLLPVSGGPLP